MSCNQASGLKRLVDKMHYGEAVVYAKEHIDFSSDGSCFKLPEHKTKLRKEEALDYYGAKVFARFAVELIEKIPHKNYERVLKFLKNQVKE